MTSIPSNTNPSEEAVVRLAAIRQRVVQAAVAAGREPSSVRLLAVSKGHPAETVRALYQSGQRDFGENYVQEWLVKRESLADLTELRWHFIGNLQSNKAKHLVDAVACVQSVDRASVAEVLERLQLRREDHAEKLAVLIEMEVDSSDMNKGGVPQDEAAALCELLVSCHELEWLGFMGMGPADAPPERLSELYVRFVERSQALWHQFGRAGTPVISLGMSDDLEVAVAAGSTMVRVGTAIFGERSK